MSLKSSHKPLRYLTENQRTKSHSYFSCKEIYTKRRLSNKGSLVKIKAQLTRYSCAVLIEVSMFLQNLLLQLMAPSHTHPHTPTDETEDMHYGKNWISSLVLYMSKHLQITCK